MDIAIYSSDSRAVIKVAKEIAASFHHMEICPEHLLIAVVRSEVPEVDTILAQLEKSPAFIESIAEAFLKEQAAKSSPRQSLRSSPAVQEILAQASEEKSNLYDALVEPEHILIALFDPRSNLSPVVREKVDIRKEDIYNAIAESKSIEEIASPTIGRTDGEGNKPGGRGEISGILKYCIDMTNQAASGEFDPMVGREKELREVIQILLRRRKNSPVLVGGAGVGKSAIVEGFARAAVENLLPEVMREIKVIQVDMGSLVAGAKYKGEFEERFKTLIGEVVKSRGKIILFIDEIHTLVGAGNVSGGMDAANLLKPALARGQIRLIGATTEEEYTRFIEKDKALDRRFERVKVYEPNLDEAVRIVSGVIDKYESHHHLTFVDEAVQGAVKLAKRYLSERNLPDIALDLVDEAASEFLVKEEMGKRRVAKIESQITQIEKLIDSCEGKDSHKDEDVESFRELQELYDDFTGNMETLQVYWGHRVEMAAGAK